MPSMPRRRKRSFVIECVQLCLTMTGIRRKRLFPLLCSRCSGCQRDVLPRFLGFFRKIQLYHLLVLKRVRLHLKCTYFLFGFDLFVPLSSFLKNSLVWFNFPKCLLEDTLTGAGRTIALLRLADSGLSSHLPWPASPFIPVGVAFFLRAREACR